MGNRSVGGFEVPKSEAGTARAKIAEQQEASTRQQSSYGGGGWQSRGGGGTAGCFPAGTTISAPDGLVDIAQVQNGDVVYAVDPTSGRRTARAVLCVKRFSGRRIWRVTLAEGGFLRTTALHSLRVGDRWQKASTITAGDTIARIDDRGLLRHAVVAGSCAEDREEDVYTLVVEGAFTFVADGSLVHCFTYCRHVRMCAWGIVARLRRMHANVIRMRPAPAAE